MERASPISFPKDEWDAIEARIAEGKVSFTIRVSNELGKYSEGSVYITEWGRRVKILSVKRISDGIKELENAYEHFSELTPAMVKALSPFQNMEIITFLTAASK